MLTSHNHYPHPAECKNKFDDEMLIGCINFLFNVNETCCCKIVRQLNICFLDLFGSSLLYYYIYCFLSLY